MQFVGENKNMIIYNPDIPAQNATRGTGPSRNSRFSSGPNRPWAQDFKILMFKLSPTIFSRKLQPKLEFIIIKINNRH